MCAMELCGSRGGRRWTDPAAAAVRLGGTTERGGRQGSAEAGQCGCWAVRMLCDLHGT